MNGPTDSPRILLARALRQKCDRGETRVRLSPEERAALKRYLKSSRPTSARQTPPSTPSAPNPTPGAQPPAHRTQHPAPQSPHSDLPLENLILPGAGKAEQIEHLRRIALACERCPHLVATRTQVVFGVGDINADLMFVGEAPGADEDRQGEPFVGRAGQLLTKMIETMGLSRAQVYIGNVLKCRPDMPRGSTGNRQPTESEMATCLPYLQAQVAIIKPKVIVTLGGTAIQGLLGLAGGVGWHRGHWQQYDGIPVMPTYHPAYLLRSGSIETKRKVWEDLLAVMERLGMPISAKQRGYFLKGT